MLSSYEVEYIIASLCACQPTWMVNMIENISGEDHEAMTMKIENMSDINLAENWKKTYRDEVPLFFETK